MRIFSHSAVCANTHGLSYVLTHVHNNATLGTVTQRAKLLVLDPIKWITSAVCSENHRYV